MCVGGSFENPRMLRLRSLEILLQLVQVGPKGPCFQKIPGNLCVARVRTAAFGSRIDMYHSFTRCSFILLKKERTGQNGVTFAMPHGRGEGWAGLFSREVTFELRPKKVSKRPAWMSRRRTLGAVVQRP